MRDGVSEAYLLKLETPMNKAILIIVRFNLQQDLFMVEKRLLLIQFNFEEIKLNLLIQKVIFLSQN